VEVWQCSVNSYRSLIGTITWSRESHAVSHELKLVTLREIPDDAELRQKWNALAARVHRPQVFYTYEWSVAVQRAYSATLNPLIFLAYDEQESLCGIAALAIGAAGTDVSFLCATTGDYCDFLSLPEDKQTFLTEILAALRKEQIRNITLTNLPADSDTLAAIRRAAGPNGYRCFARTAYICAQISLEALERNPKDNKPVLPRKKMVRRFLSAMGRETPVRLNHARTWDEIKPVLPAFMQAHVARFLMTGRISNLARPERRVFLEELARLLAESGWVTMSCLASGEQKLAWNYGFQFDDTFFWYQPTFDSALEKYSPGFCLLSKIIEEAAASSGLKTVDLGLGDEGYKDRFSNQTRRTLYVTLRTSRSIHAREVLRYSAASALKRIPALDRGIRMVVAGFGLLKEKIDREGLIGFLTRLPGRCREFVWSNEEVFFFEWIGSSAESTETYSLIPLDVNRLADAVAEYHDDPSTLNYLLRAASRLKTPTARGFALADSKGEFLHFAWVTEFDGFFLSELNAKVDAPALDAVMVYDCWTPPAMRGHGYYAQAVTLLADHMRKEGKNPWIFSAARNTASLRGLEKAGFRRSYALIRQGGLLWQRIKGKTPKPVETLVTENSARLTQN
jgi:CelD/BcsL family acetyltransferase involved in cellulose biosynthesis/RimJ/RimL family protein N-acetyltransferase